MKNPGQKSPANPSSSLKILGIETSCDDTCAAVVENGDTILSNIVSSQIDIFKNYGGVIPEVAARSHLESILPVIHRALSDARLTINDIDAISVTHTPGLLGSLLIGTLTARTLAITNHKPFYPVHHLKSHIYANWLTTPTQDISKPTFPLLALVISGGHTQIIYMEKHNHFKIIGTTLDDAIGECFDKVAKILGLEYPGGPAISAAAAGHIRLAKSPSSTDSNSKSTTKNSSHPGNPEKYPFPHPKTEHPYDFSFSGLKTAVLRSVQKSVDKPISFPSYELKNFLTPEQIADFSASFQKTAVDYLLEKLALATKHYKINSLVFAGGVSANTFLREKALKKFSPINVFFPEPKLSGDNGAMVASACFYEIQSGIQPNDPYTLTLLPRSDIS